MYAQREERKAKKKAMGFEQSPPRCANCQLYLAPAHGVPQGVRREVYYSAPTCTLGQFPVKPYSICDHWEGINGETLHAEKNQESQA